jgi:hypothetical protein
MVYIAWTDIRLLAPAVIAAFWLHLATAEPRAVELEVRTPRTSCAPDSGCVMRAQVAKLLPGREAEPPTTAQVVCAATADGETHRGSGYASVANGEVSGSVSVDTGQHRQLDSVKCTAYIR